MNREQFEHLCRLARLELSPEELADFAAKFDKLLVFIKDIQQHNPDGDKAPFVLGANLKFRADTVRAFEWPEGQQHDYQVPQIIDFEGDG